MIHFILTLVFLIFAMTLNSFSQIREVPNDWKEINMCGFSFLIPKKLKKQKICPIDSCVGVFKSKNISVSFDSGRHTSTPGNAAIYLDSKFEWIQINGKKAHLTTFSRGARVYIKTSKDEKSNSNFTSALGFSISINKEKDAEIARKIIENIRFEIK